MEEWEKLELETLRKTLKISPSTHKAILAEYSLIEGVPFEVHFKRSSFINHHVGTRGECILQIQAKIAIQQLELYWHCDTEAHTVQEYPFLNLRSGRSRTETISVVPRLPGQYSVDVVCLNSA